MDLDALVGTYPDQFEPGAAYNLAKKKEFYDYHATPSEPGHRAGTPFKHQENFARLIESGVITRIANIDETGSGKTCKFGYAAERVKRLLELGDLRGKYKRAIVLVPGRILRDEIANQLVCSCTQGIYDVGVNSTATTDQGIRKVITTNLAVFYRIETYGKFANQVINNFRSEQSLIEEYSNTIFLCDEIHSLNIIKTGGTGQDSGKWNTKPAELTIKSFQEFVDKKHEAQESQRGRGVVNKNTEIYSLLWLVFHSIKNSVVILSSATPAINNINELTPVCNLLLPADRQINFNLSTATEEQLVPYFNGLFTFTRALDTGVDVIDIGEVITTAVEDEDTSTNLDQAKSKKKLFFTKLSEFQSKAYKAARDNGQTTFKIEVRQLAKGVFPDGTSGGVPFRHGGNGTFDRWIQSEENKYEFTTEMLAELKVPGAVDKYFGPIANAIRISIEQPGGAFYYFEYTFGIGAILGGLLAGYIYDTEYASKSSLGRSRAGSSKPRVLKAERFAPIASAIESGTRGMKLCSAGSSGTEKINISKRFRYAIITNETGQRQIEHILALRNHPDNVNGEYLALIFGSPISRDGININSLADIHIMIPSWTEAGEYQAKSRGIRAKSHEERLRVDREQMRADGKSEEEIAQYRPSVHVYHHASLLADGTPTDDVRYYHNSEQKNIVIIRIMRIAKQCAIDYYLNRHRNIRDYDVDGYAPWGLDADGNPIDYPLDLDGEEGADTSTYDIYYAQPEIDIIIKHIKLLFKQKYLYTLNQISDRLPEHRRILVVTALARLISTRQIITDRYGFAHYVVLMNGYVAITRDYPIKPFDYTGTFSVGLTTTTSTPLATIAKDYRYESTKDIITAILEGDHLYTDDLINLDTEATSDLIEKAISQYYLNESTLVVEEILKHYADSYDSVYYPVTLINMYSDYYASRENPTGPGARAKTTYNPDKILPYIDEDGGEVYFYHIMMTRPNTTDNAYNLNAWLRTPKGTIRVMNQADGVWRDANPEEEAAFRSHAVAKYEQTRLSNNTFTGKYDMKTKKFYIINNRDEISRYGPNGAPDKRTQNRGHVCNTYHVPQICKLLALLDIDPDDHNPRGSPPIEAYGDDVADLDDVQLERYYAWRGIMAIPNYLTKADACSLIKTTLEQGGEMTD